jgi:CARDB
VSKLVQLSIAGLAAAACAGAIVLSGPATAAARRGSAASASPRTALAGFACVHALNPSDRRLSITGVMRPLSGTWRMAMRFQLLERPLTSGPEVLVRAGDLGTWISPPNPTVGRQPRDVWKLLKTVDNLDVPAAYRLRVSFRWYDQAGHSIGTSVRLTHFCRERELRPDLATESIAISAVAGHPNRELYTATIANLGLTGAGPFQVLFVPGDGSSPVTRTIHFLHAHQTKLENFVGPVCNAASPPTVTADATNVIDDFNPANNELAAVCPG